MPLTLSHVRNVPVCDKVTRLLDRMSSSCIDWRNTKGRILHSPGILRTRHAGRMPATRPTAQCRCDPTLNRSRFSDEYKLKRYRTTIRSRMKKTPLLQEASQKVIPPTNLQLDANGCQHNANIAISTHLQQNGHDPATHPAGRRKLAEDRVRNVLSGSPCEA